jgi:hypothetical protein
MGQGNGTREWDKGTGQENGTRERDKGMGQENGKRWVLAPVPGREAGASQDSAKPESLREADIAQNAHRDA